MTHFISFALEIFRLLNRLNSGRKTGDGRQNQVGYLRRCQAIDANGYVLKKESMRPSDRKTSHRGFGLTGERDDVQTFSWDWFEVDRPGHAAKLLS
jgi:hypothetical protein